MGVAVIIGAWDWPFMCIFLFMFETLRAVEEKSYRF